MHLSIYHKLDEPTSRMNGTETELLDEMKIKQQDMKYLSFNNIIPYNCQ